MSIDERTIKDAANFHVVMGCLRDMKLEHGLCEPRERKACTHCNAKERLDQMLAEYKGPPVFAI